MAKKNAIVKKQSGGLAKWDAELAKYAEEAADLEQTPAGNFISLKGGILTVAGQPVQGNKALVIVLDSIYENACYEGAYDADNPQPPVCYAFSREEEELKPHEKASDPKHEQCAGCPCNVFGTADQGKGKACKNIRRLAVISASGLSPESVKQGEVFFLKVPVTSTKTWAYYVKGTAATMRRPPFAVITELGVVPDSKSQFKVTFTPMEPVGAEVMEAIMEKREEVMRSIMFPYPDAPAPAPAKGKKGKKGKATAATKARKF